MDRFRLEIGFHPGEAFLVDHTLFTSVVLDGLILALLGLALITFVVFVRNGQRRLTRANAPWPARGTGGAFIHVMLILPVAWLLLVWAGTSLLSPPVTTGQSTHTPGPRQNPAVAPPNDLIAPGMLTVGTDPNNLPQEYPNPTTGALTGFDVELITAIAQRMGLHVKLVPTKFDALLPHLDARRFDVVISAVNITADHQTLADFVPYFKASESLLVQEVNPKRIQGLATLCSLKVGVQQGSREQAELQQQSRNCQALSQSGITILAEASEAEVIQLLAQRSVDATYQDTPAADYYVQHQPGFTVAAVIPAPQEGIAVRKGDTSMFVAIQAAYEALKRDGTYHRLIVEWQLTKEELG
jgi:polar amino acid transport system substrate-binding protein